MEPFTIDSTATWSLYPFWAPCPSADGGTQPTVAAWPNARCDPGAVRPPDPPGALDPPDAPAAPPDAPYPSVAGAVLAAPPPAVPPDPPHSCLVKRHRYPFPPRAVSRSRRRRRRPPSSRPCLAPLKRR